MPTINLTEEEMVIATNALKNYLEADQLLGLLAARGVVDTHALSGETRAALADLFAKFYAVAKEHV